MNKNLTKKGLIICGPPGSGKTTLIGHILAQHKSVDYKCIQNFYALKTLPFELLLGKGLKLIIFEGTHFDYDSILGIYQSIVSTMTDMKRQVPSIIFSFQSRSGEVNGDVISRDIFHVIELGPHPFNKLKDNSVYHI